MTQDRQTIARWAQIRALQPPPAHCSLAALFGCPREGIGAQLVDLIDQGLAEKLADGPVLLQPGFQDAPHPKPRRKWRRRTRR